MDLLAVQGTLKSLLQHHSSIASILQHSAFFTVQLSHPYLNIGKIIALTRRTFVGKVTSLLFNMLSRLVITFLPRSQRSPSRTVGTGVAAVQHWRRCEEIHHIQGQRRSPSKTVGGAKSCLESTPYCPETLRGLKHTLCAPGPRDPTETETEQCLSIFY